MKNLLGVLYVAIGAGSYGILATIIKLANQDGYHISGLTFLQFGIGFIVLTILSLCQKCKNSLKSKVRLTLFGTSLGLTSCFYYLSIQYLPVSIGIILLMQAIWVSVVLEFILTKTLKKEKVIGALLVILGTLLAVNITQSTIIINKMGILFGLLASLSYTMALFASNKIELQTSNICRSQFLVFGGLIIVILFWNTELITQTHFWNINLWVYGLILAVFGTLIPPFFFNKGFPLTGIGLGSIVASIEIPISVLSAHFLLNEQIKIIQWVGIVLILVSVGIINMRKNGSEKTSIT